MQNINKETIALLAKIEVATDKLYDLTENKNEFIDSMNSTNAKSRGIRYQEVKSSKGTK